MNDKDITYRWLTVAELEEQQRGAVEAALDTAMREIGDLDPHIYHEDTIRAAILLIKQIAQRVRG